MSYPVARSATDERDEKQFGGHDRACAADAEQVREKLKAVRGKKYWRSVDELADTPEFQAAVEKEFPSRRRTRGAMRFRGAAF